MWTCVVCGGDGPGVMLSCANKCRACENCAFPPEDCAFPRHVCTDRKTLFDQLSRLGAPREALCLPDCGKGRKEWKKHCKNQLTWADPARTFFGVKDSSAIVEIYDSKKDPLEHPDVVAVVQ